MGRGGRSRRGPGRGAIKLESIIAFTKVALPFGWLGNMAPYPVTYGGKAWRTTEALFQT